MVRVGQVLDVKRGWDGTRAWRFLEKAYRLTLDIYARRVRRSRERFDDSTIHGNRTYSMRDLLVTSRRTVALNAEAFSTQMLRSNWYN